MIGFPKEIETLNATILMMVEAMVKTNADNLTINSKVVHKKTGREYHAKLAIKPAPKESV